MDLASSSHWQPVDRAAFTAWLRQFALDHPMGMAGGYSLHPIPLYLDVRDGGFWCIEVTRERVKLTNRHVPTHPVYTQEGWLLDFCWELKKPDAYANVNVSETLAALDRVP